MPYYMMLSADIKGLFGPGATKQSIIKKLKDNGISDAANFDGLTTPARLRTRRVFDSSCAMLLGTDEESRKQLVDDLAAHTRGADEIGLVSPAVNEWLACVTFVDPAAPAKPKFQVVALVGSSALQKAGVKWPKEDTPPIPWATYVADPPGAKKIREIINFNGGGRW